MPSSDYNRERRDEDEAAPSGIEGYVLDNMEGAVDQASFLAKLDIPIAIIGPHGTGKMYVARVVHQESGRTPGMIVQIDCRAFRNRDDAIRRLQKELAHSEGKTLVFKSPHLMSAEAQVKLARQIATRTLADVTPARYLPDVKLVALFPDSLEQLMLRAGLSQKLASVFAGFPINVPPIKDRKQAVLRWADKILGQESTKRNLTIQGFTADAEQAMLAHEWLGNISEMRQRIVLALEAAASANREWITPVDLGIFQDRSGGDHAQPAIPESFLSSMDKISTTQDNYTPTALEQLDAALGEAVYSNVGATTPVPLGAWLADDLVVAAKQRFRGSLRSTAEFLHTNPRNITRWMVKIDQREQARNSCLSWRDSHRLAGEWIRAMPLAGESPLETAQTMLLSHLEKLSDTLRVATRAKIMGMSTPTYQKKLREQSGDHG